MNPVLYEAADGVALVTLNRPERGNAWTGRMETEYRRAMTSAEHDPGVRVVVVTGAGDRFCVGADRAALDSMRGTGQYDSGLRDELSTPVAGADADLSGRHSFLLSMTKPVIAAVNGAAAGVGFVLCCFADLRFAAARAKLTTSSARLGLPAEFGLTWLLPRMVGTGRAADLLLTSRVVLAEEAERIGLVNRVWPAEELLDRSMETARELASERAGSSLRVIKQQLYADLRGTLAEAEATYHAKLQEMVGSPDFREGVAALTERRPPNFLGHR
jgi:enoyl-CoA hydratase/carnithine racemase